MSEAQRDASDNAVKKALQEAARDLAALAAGSSDGHDDAARHREGVCGTLREMAAGATALLLEQRQYRTAQAAQSARPVRLAPDLAGETAWRGGEEEGDDEGFSPEEEALLQTENEAVLREMNCLNSQVEDCTRKMQEIAELASLFSAKMVEQQEMATTVYDLTVESSSRINAGNENMEKAPSLPPP